MKANRRRTTGRAFALTISLFFCNFKGCYLTCRDGGIGRRTGLKIPRWKHHVGSSPTPGTRLRSLWELRPAQPWFDRLTTGLFKGRNLTPMTNKDCIFCKIIAGEIPAKIVAQDDDIIVIQDRAPKMPVHYLIMPKIHIDNVQALQEKDAHYIGKMMLMAKKLSQNSSGSQSFRLIMNNGADSGQSVFHLHCHFLSGKKMTDF